MMSDGEETTKKASHLQAVRAVFWSFFGVRRNRDYQSDAMHLTMTQVVVSGIIGAILFVATLLLLVYFVTR
jgi:hypothetical protein